MSQLVLFCPECGNRAPQTILFHELEAESQSEDNFDPFAEKVIVTRCGTCSQVLVYKHENGGVPTERECVWPMPRKLGPGVPSQIIAVYDEAARIRSIAPNAFAAQIRKGLEALCKDRGIGPGKSLASGLKELSDRDEIPGVLSQMSSVLRTLGNIGAHPGDEEVASYQAFAIDEFFRAIVEYVYVAPYRLRQFEARLEALKKPEKPTDGIGPA